LKRSKNENALLRWLKPGKGDGWKKGAGGVGGAQSSRDG